MLNRISILLDLVRSYQQFQMIHAEEPLSDVRAERARHTARRWREAALVHRIAPQDVIQWTDIRWLAKPLYQLKPLNCHPRIGKQTAVDDQNAPVQNVTERQCIEKF
jgi:hypothetical protein